MYRTRIPRPLRYHSQTYHHNQPHQYYQQQQQQAAAASLLNSWLPGRSAGRSRQTVVTFSDRNVSTVSIYPLPGYPLGTQLALNTRLDVFKIVKSATVWCSRIVYAYLK